MKVRDKVECNPQTINIRPIFRESI